jgi:hypothetical protein
MKKQAGFYWIGMVLALVLSFPLISWKAQGDLINLSPYLKSTITSEKTALSFPKLNVVRLSGKINHFGNPDYDATVPGVKVWIAEFPFTKYLNIRSDDTGWWTMDVIKLKGIDMHLSFVYEKEGWITTKSNKIRITDEDNLDLAIQFIDPNLYTYGLKPMMEEYLRYVLQDPSFTLKNAMVVTVGKSWASMHSDRLPHGDPGAIALASPQSSAIGPIYFDESVTPNPYYTSTSVDGGVTWINVPTGTYKVTAQKPGVNYQTVTFDVNKTDAKNGIVLYIASPPDSVIGDSE